MGNAISIKYCSEREIFLNLSNNATEALIASLVIAISREILESVEESAGEFTLNDFLWDVGLVMHLSDLYMKSTKSIDGFDLLQLQWSDELFPEQKKSLLLYVERAIQLSPENLSTIYNINRLLPNLGSLRMMIENLKSNDIGFSQSHTTANMHSKPAVCDVHKVFRNSEGCLLCNVLENESKA